MSSKALHLKLNQSTTLSGVITLSVGQPKLGIPFPILSMHQNLSHLLKMCKKIESIFIKYDL